MMFFYSLIAILIPAAMGGLRTTYIGVDVGGYVVPSFIRSMRAANFAEFAPYGLPLIGESGWVVVTYFTAKIFEHVNWNLFMYQLINVSCFYIGAWRFRKTVPLWLVMLLFFFIGYNHTYNLVRQSLACAVVFMCMDALAARKYGRVFLYIIAANWFHTSAIICFGYVLLLHMIITSKRLWRHNESRKNFILYSMFGLLAFTRPIISLVVYSLPALEKYQGYADVTIDMVAGFFGVGWAQVLLNIGELIIFLLYANGGKKMFAAKWKGGVGMFEYCRYIVVLMIVFRFGVGFFDRMIFYLEYINILILASLPGFVKEKHLRAVLLAAVIGASLISWWYIHVQKGVFTGNTWPYRSILD